MQLSQHSSWDVRVMHGRRRIYWSRGHVHGGCAWVRCKVESAEYRTMVRQQQQSSLLSEERLGLLPPNLLRWCGLLLLLRLNESRDTGDGSLGGERISTQYKQEGHREGGGNTTRVREG